MLEHTSIVDFSFEYLEKAGFIKENCVFFDIETTGLRASRSNLYLIGAAAYEDDHWTLHQWLAQSKDEEADIIQAFSAYILTKYPAPASYQLIHYNGDRFDLPYMQEVCDRHNLENPFKYAASTDLYQIFQPLKRLLKLDHMKQRSLEDFLQIDRQDRYDGGLLIPVYKSYCKQIGKNDEETKTLEEVLLLHNREDLTGMLQLSSLYSYLFLIQNGMKLSKYEVIEDNGPYLLLTFTLNLPVPKPISYAFFEGNPSPDTKKYLPQYLCYLTAEGNEARLLVYMHSGTLYFYFPDYQNYYYLPKEDMAIHKSIASFVSRKYRRKARAVDSYIKKESIFLPCQNFSDFPAFLTHFKAKISFVEAINFLTDNFDDIQAYAEHLLSLI